MNDILYNIFLLLGSFLFLFFQIRVFSRTTDEYAAKENATNKEYGLALIKRMLVYPCLVAIGIIFTCTLLYVALSVAA